jgi:hypothetical protein
VRFTLVQEGLRWLDTAGHGAVWQDVQVVVT